jgi:predicted RNase H-like HicB family nuclease
MGKYINTAQRGSVRYIVFKDGEDWFAVGLEFNIVESGTSPQEAMMLLNDALIGYVEAAKKNKVRPSVLNQKADKEYEELWEKRANNKNIWATGEFNLMRIPAIA